MSGFTHPLPSSSCGEKRLPPSNHEWVSEAFRAAQSKPIHALAIDHDRWDRTDTEGVRTLGDVDVLHVVNSQLAGRARRALHLRVNSKVKRKCDHGREHHHASDFGE